MSNSKQPIGVFDSGVGGLSVAKKIREALPCEDIIYVADSRNAPYGNKTQPFIEQRSTAITQFLIEQGAKAVVVACNTATLSAIQTLRTQFTVPIIGVEPGIKPAVAQTRCGVAGVMVTTRTSQSENFHQLIQRVSQNTRIAVQACDGLVEQIEKGELDSEQTRALVTNYVQQLCKQGVDVIALGCTHYPFLLPLIQEVAGRQINIIETGTAVANQVVRRLSDEGHLAMDGLPGKDIFYTTGDVIMAEKIMSSLWLQAVQVNACSA